MGSEGSALRSRASSRASSRAPSPSPSGRTRSRTPSFSLQVEEPDNGGGGRPRSHSFTNTDANTNTNHQSGRLSPNLSAPTWDYENSGGGGGGGGHSRRHSASRISLSFKGKGKQKARAPRLPPKVISRIIGIILARTYEMGEVQYRMAGSVLKSVNREIRNLTMRQQITTVYIASGDDLQKYEALMHDDFPPPFLDEDVSPPNSPTINSPRTNPNSIHHTTYAIPPLHPRDLTKHLVLGIGGQRYNYYKERSILNFVSLGDCERLLHDPVLSVNLESVRLEFRRGHPTGLVNDILGGMSEERRKGLKSLVVRCGEMEGCREHDQGEKGGEVGGGGESDDSSSSSSSHHHRKSSSKKQHHRGTHHHHHQPQQQQTFLLPLDTLLPSITHIALTCASHTLAHTLLAHCPKLQHLRLGGGAFSVLPSVRDTSPKLLSVTLELKNGRREWDAWCIPKALEGGLLSPLPLVPVRRRMVPKRKQREAESSEGGEEVQRTLYLEGVNELTLRWRGDLQQVSAACQKARVRLVQPPPPPYEAGLSPPM